jgi:predicted transcriptional regulator
MEIVYGEKQGVTANDVQKALGGEVSNSAVRTHLRILESKGHLCHTETDGKYVYTPTKPRDTAARSALSQVMTTFFGGSVERIVATLLSEKEAEISDAELARLQQLIDDAREKGR